MLKTVPTGWLPVVGSFNCNRDGSSYGKNGKLRAIGYDDDYRIYTDDFDDGEILDPDYGEFTLLSYSEYPIY